MGEVCSVERCRQSQQVLTVKGSAKRAMQVAAVRSLFANKPPVASPDLMPIPVERRNGHGPLGETSPFVRRPLVPRRRMFAPASQGRTRFPQKAGSSTTTCSPQPSQRVVQSRPPKRYWNSWVVVIAERLSAVFSNTQPQPHLLSISAVCAEAVLTHFPTDPQHCRWWSKTRLQANSDIPRGFSTGRVHRS